MRKISLCEYAPEEGVQLTESEAARLRQAAPSLALSPSSGRPGFYDLRSGSSIGSISVGDLSIVIRPKLAIERVLFLIAYSLSNVRWDDLRFDWQEAESLAEAMIPGFVHQVRRVLRRGLLQGYRTRETSSSALRGRIRFEDQIRDRYGRFPPLEIRYDEYSVDTEENRLLLAAVDRLLRLRLRSSGLRRDLGRLAAGLDGVTRVEYSSSSVPAITYTRLNEHYRPACELARWILKHVSHDVGHGGWRSSSFLVDMNKVFEDFVVVALRETLGLSERAFPQNARGRQLHLDEAGKVRLEPDLSWWRRGRCVFVGDVKYKHLEERGFKHGDLYQMLAYLVATNLDSGLLIYAAGEGEPASHRVRFLGRVIDVIQLDLSGNHESVLGQIGRVAMRLRRMAERTGREAA